MGVVSIQSGPQTSKRVACRIERRFPSSSWYLISPVRVKNQQDQHLDGSPGAAPPSNDR
jgi:hypothetical protein